MHITELRIAGFKSFVDPQDLPVEPGLTGIVGPNGCGKSNLLEALRWAMGASSARAMRGGEMDDLIFSGAEGRPGRETAEVTLVLDNTKRTAPPDFNQADTLEVMRRLRRGAGSTYKLNGRTVRGKDIQLLFADASTGANSPSLVRQGQISEMIAAKPQNRRRILEEAAGISGLNTRRHEAELKLRAAETNLERLSEVSAEVERQLESLKRQARKARKYKALSDEIAALDAFIAHCKWLAAGEAEAAANAALETAKTDVERLTREAAINETARLQAGEGIAPLREAESVAAAKLGQARIELARLETERKAASEAAERLEAERTRLMEDIAREETAQAEAEAAATEAREELAALPVDTPGESEAQEQAARAALEVARNTLSDAETGADTAQAALAEARARQEAAEAGAAAARQRVEKLKADEARLAAELANLPDIAALRVALETARQAEADAEIALADCERAVERADAALAEAREAEASAEPGRAEADKAVRALEAEIAGLARLLRKAEATNTPPVIDRIRTEDGYERAVAAALGDDLQASTDRAAALYWAGAGPQGQPLPDGATPLTQFVDAPNELAARLSQCGLIAAEDGPRLARALKTGQRLVSREGHLWRWDGFTRTPEAPVSAAERLEQQARLEAAEAELSPAQAERDRASEALDHARAERRAAEETLRTARTAVQPASRALSDTRAASANAAGALERAEFRRDSAESSLAQLRGELSAAEENLALAQPAGAGETDLAALQAALEAARAAVTAARTDETEARGRLTDLTRGREQAQKRRDGLARDAETWSQRATASAARLERLQQRRHDADAEAERAKQAPERLAAELETLSHRVAQLETERQAAADRLAERETALREAEAAARTSEAAVASARESLAGAKVKLETSAARLADLKEQAREQFGRTPDGLLVLAGAGLDEETLDTLSQAEAEQRLTLLRHERDQLGGVNMEAEAEAEELAERLGAQTTEKADLVAAIAKLREGVDALNEEGRGRLLEAFETVNEHFKALFTTLFRGGQAELKLIDAEDPLAAGLEIYAQPPGKRLGTLSLMSGGEQALTAAALIFAVFLSRPAPICVLDEVDAPLDDANVDRFCRMLEEMRARTDTRFIIITHNPVTMSRMDRLFGVTMREKGVSKLVSVDLGTAEELVAAE